MERIGSWDLVSELARGGMGVVWRAQHTKTGQAAALKTLRRADARTTASFRREVRALARVRHPGVVRILDHGEHEHRPWLAMELIEGAPLRSHEAMTSTGVSSSNSTWFTGAPATALVPEPTVHLQWTAQTLQPGLDLFRTVCSALAGLHAHGLVHRDLKPDNALVRPDGSVVLVDLGLATARRAGRESVDIGDLAAGTAAYMAPEQARGEIPDARADLYALGCMLQEWLTGAPPFGGTPSEVVRGHLFAAPPSVHARTDGVPEALADLVRDLLAKDASDRPARVDVVSARLEALGSLPIEGDPQPPQLFRPGLAGRQVEEAQLAELVEVVSHGGTAGVAIRAPSGTGKTRLALEIAGLARRRGLVVHAAECIPGIPVPFAPMQPLLSALADFAAADVDRFRSEVVGAILLGSVSPQMAHVVGSVPDADPSAFRRRARAFRTALSRLASNRPVMLLIDDLQWADAGTAGWIALLAADPIPGVFVLATTRPEGNPRGLDALDLNPLTARAAAQVAGDVLGVREAPRRVREVVGSYTPFHVTEWLRAATEEEVLVPDAAIGWRITSEERLAELAHLPTSQLVLRRLDRLPQALDERLEAAAVLGREVNAEVLARVCPCSTDEALDAVSTLIARWVLVDTPMGPRFSHDQLRERAYARIDPDRCALLHSRAADALDRTPNEVRALHLEKAGRVAEAVLAWERACSEAERRFSWTDVEHFSRRAMALAPPEEAIRIGSMTLMRAILAIGETPRAKAEAAALVEQALDLGDDRALIRAYMAEGRAGIAGSHRENAEAAAERAVELAQQIDDPELLGWAWELMSKVVYHQGQKGRALEAAEASQAAFDRVGLRPANALLTRGLALREAGRLDQAEVVLREALAIERTKGGWGIAVTSNSLGGLLLYQGRVAEGEQLLLETQAMHEQMGTMRDLGFTLHDLGEANLIQGRPDKALEYAERSRETFIQTGDLAYEALVEVMWLQALYETGRVEVVRREGLGVLQRVQERGVLMVLPQAHVVLGRVALDAGDLEAATEHGLAAKEAAEAHGQPLVMAWVLCLLADLSAAKRNLDAAKAWVDQAVAIAAHTGFAQAEAIARGTRFRLFGTEADRIRARELWERMGNQLELARL